MVSFAQNIIVNDGKAKSQIIIDSNADSITRYAAEELQIYIEKISGTLVPINNKRKGKVVNIFIGDKYLNNSNLKTLRKLKEDAFLIISEKNKVFLAGKNPIGNIYAVYTLLEEFFGCIKYNVTEKYIPKSSKLSVPYLNKSYNPSFEFRLPHFLGRWDKDYSNWHKINNFNDWGMFVHTFHVLVPPEEYFDKHPEYFALVDNRRLKDGQLCLSNNNLIDLLISNLAKEMEKAPEKKYWSVSQNDCYNYCECTDCQTLYNKYNSYSGAYVLMSNKIAEAFPDKQISTLAYQFTREAPENIIPKDNVNIMFCSIECNRSMPLEDDPRSTGFVNDMKNWGKLTSNILVWDYVVQFKNYLTPFPNFHVLQPNINFFRDNNVSMMFQQGSGHSWSDLSDIKQYLIAKLLWDNTLNADSIVNRFIYSYYGKAAPFIREYFDITHNELIRVQEKQNLDIYGFPVLYSNAHLTPELLLQYEEIFDRAEIVVKDDSLYLKRVLKTRLPVDFALMEIALNLPTERLTWIEEKDNELQINERLLTKMARFVENCRLTGVNTINERSYRPLEFQEYTLRKVKLQLMDNKLKDASSKLLTNSSPKYEVGGINAISDGLMGGLGFRFNWLGFEGEDMIILSEFDTITSINSVRMNFLKDVNSWVFIPTEVIVETSKDGINFKTVGKIKGDNSDRSYLVKSIPFEFKFENEEIKYIRFTATSMKTNPDWHRGFGRPSWIFVDEIIVQ